MSSSSTWFGLGGRGQGWEGGGRVGLGWGLGSGWGLSSPSHLRDPVVRRGSIHGLGLGALAFGCFSLGFEQLVVVTSTPKLVGDMSPLGGFVYVCPFHV